jgi:hypothetical protein
MDAEAAEEWTVRCRMPQPSSESRQTLGGSHTLPLLEVPTGGRPALERAAWPSGSEPALRLSCPTRPPGINRTTLPSERYIDAQKAVITGQPLGIYEGFSRNLRLSPSQRCACLMETKKSGRLTVNRVLQASSSWVGSEETAEHGSDVSAAVIARADRKTPGLLGRR